MTMNMTDENDDYFRGYTQGHIQGYNEGYIQAKDIYFPDWISVKDQLPLYKECILVLYNEYTVEAIYRGEYEENLHVFRIELIMEDIKCKIGERITHWMRLPEIPDKI